MLCGGPSREDVCTSGVYEEFAKEKKGRFVDELLMVKYNKMTSITVHGYYRGDSIFARVVVTDEAGRGYSTLGRGVRDAAGAGVRATGMSTSGTTRITRLVETCGPSTILGITLPCRSLAVVSTYLRTNTSCVSATGCRTRSARSPA